MHTAATATANEHLKCRCSREAMPVANGRSCAWHAPLRATVQAGGHTIGAASCGSFAYRVGADPAMDPALAQQVLARCPGGGPAGFAFLDATTPLRFDNEYYRNLLGGMGILASDQVLYADPRSRGAVERYAADQAAFFGDFAAAMTRLGRVGVRTAADGEIRRDCRFPNPN
jgi:peroxidase